MQFRSESRGPRSALNPGQEAVALGRRFTSDYDFGIIKIGSLSVQQTH